MKHLCALLLAILLLTSCAAPTPEALPTTLPNEENGDYLTGDLGGKAIPIEELAALTASFDGTSLGDVFDGLAAAGLTLPEHILAYITDEARANLRYWPGNGPAFQQIEGSDLAVFSLDGPLHSYMHDDRETVYYDYGYLNLYFRVKGEKCRPLSAAILPGDRVSQSLEHIAIGEEVFAVVQAWGLSGTGIGSSDESWYHIGESERKLDYQVWATSTDQFTRGSRCIYNCDVERGAIEEGQGGDFTLKCTIKAELDVSYYPEGSEERESIVAANTHEIALRYDASAGQFVVEEAPYGFFPGDSWTEHGVPYALVAALFQADFAEWEQKEEPVLHVIMERYREG